MSSSELRRLQALARRLPIQNDENAHVDKDDIVVSLGLLADALAWKGGATAAANVTPVLVVADIEPGPRVIKHRLVPVVRRNPRRRVLRDLREAA